MDLTTEKTKIKYSLTDIVVYFLKLGTVGFGGPPALVSYMHRDLVEEKNGYLRVTIRKVLPWLN